MAELSGPVVSVFNAQPLLVRYSGLLGLRGGQFLVQLRELAAQAVEFPFVFATAAPLNDDNVEMVLAGAPALGRTSGRRQLKPAVNLGTDRGELTDSGLQARAPYLKAGQVGGQPPLFGLEDLSGMPVEGLDLRCQHFFGT